MTETELLKDKNYAPVKLGTVCVLGLGKTGFSVAEYLCKLIGTRVESLHIYAGEKSEFAMKSADKFLRKGATVSFDDKTIVHKYDLCVASPGIPEVSDIMKSAHENCEEVISEVELAWRECNKDCKWIAVTGTNGKTTTTSLISYILNNSKKRAVSVGNIGKVALDAVAENDRKSIYEHTEFFVAELSSYQLTLCKKFKPQVSVLLNITPDHLNWHGGFDGYKRAKFKVFNNAHTAVINQEDKIVSSNIDTIKEQVSELISVNTHQDLMIVHYKNKDFEIVNNEDLKLIGEHNYSNARCAAAVCLALGLTPDQISSGLVSFPPLEHRLELCGYVAGMYLYNDSKATNVDSVMVAMDAFPKEKAIFLMGGKDKHTDLAKLVEKSYKNLKGVILFGQAQGRFYEEFMKLEKPENFVIEKSDNMKTSFKLALEISSPGDYIVLSPACSSFDEFDNFEHRGNTFKKLVDMCKR